MTYTSVSSAAAVVWGYLISYLTATLLTEPFVRDSSGTSRNKKLLSDGSLTAPAIMTVNTLLENWSVLMFACSSNWYSKELLLLNWRCLCSEDDGQLQENLISKMRFLVIPIILASIARYILMSHTKPVNPVFVATWSLSIYYELWFFSTVLQLALLHLFERLNLHPLHATFLIMTWGLGKALDSLIQHQAFHHHADDNFNLSSNAMFICNPLDLPTNQTVPIHGCTRNYNLNQTL